MVAAADLDRLVFTTDVFAVTAGRLDTLVCTRGPQHPTAAGVFGAFFSSLRSAPDQSSKRSGFARAPHARIRGLQ